MVLVKCKKSYKKRLNPKGVRISAYTNQSRVSHSVRMRENSAEVYPTSVYQNLDTIVSVKVFLKYC